MSLAFHNACLVTDDPQSLQRARQHGVRSFSVVTTTPGEFDGESGVNIFRHITAPGELNGAGDIYVEELGLDEQLLDAVIEHILGTKARLMVRTLSDLYEAGRIEAKYKLSPVMLLHKTGLLPYAAIAGGVHLDKDDIDLMAQCNTPLIVLPVFDMLSGYGVAPVYAARHKLKISVGTYNERYNPNGCIAKEAFALQLGVSAQMERECALTAKELLSFCGTGSPDEFVRRLYQ